MGRKQVTTVPCPSALSTWIAPRCSSRIRWQIASPRPRPLSLVVKNGSKIRARTASVMPAPSSATCASTMLRAPAHRVEGVAHEVVEHLEQAVLVAEDRRQARVVAPHDRDPPLARRLLAHQRDTVEELVEVERDGPE